jgi:hypothetical protein
MMNLPSLSMAKIDRCDAINLLLTSIAAEELALAKVIQEEANKLEKGICLSRRLKDLFEVNDSVNSLLKTVIKKEIIILLTLEEIIGLDEKCNCCEERKEMEMEEEEEE